MLKKTGFLALIILLLSGCLAPGYAAAAKKPVKHKKLTAVNFKFQSMDTAPLSSGTKIKGEKGQKDQIRIPRQNKEENRNSWTYSTTE